MTTATLPRPLGQFARFALVGMTNTLVSLATYSLLLSASTPYVLAAAAAFAAGAANGYVLNRRWTFAACDSRRARLAYVCVQALGALAAAALVWLLVHEAGAGRTAAYAAAIPPVTLTTFLANRRWAFAESA